MTRDGQEACKESEGGKACSGIHVLEIGGDFGVPALAGQLFAGLGAEVRLFRPVMELDTASAIVPAKAYLDRLLHTGKDEVPRLPGMAEEAAALAALVEWADVVIVDRTRRCGLPVLADPDSFHRRWPAKILCMVSMFGARSSRPDWIGDELIVEAASALMACNGYPELPPVASGLPFALHTSALFAFNAIMVALRERDRSGQGQPIDLAIVDCIIAILGNFLPSYFLSGRTPQRIGNRHTIAAPWNIYPALDGRVVICTGTGGTGWWAKLMGVIDRPELTEDPRYATEADRVRNVDEVDAIVSEWTSGKTMQAIVEQMSAKGIPSGEISTIEAVLRDAHYRDLRGMIIAGDRDALPLVGIPIKIGDADMPSSEPDPERQPRVHGRTSGEGPLSGLRILEFASRTSVPLAGRMFADFGADVVKIEPPKGDALRGAGLQIGGASYLFHINNAGKRSITIDPTDQRGRDLILDLARHADVFIENLAPGSVNKMGLGAQAMRDVNPGLVYCSVSGFGIRSAHGSKRALDTVVQASSGLMYMTGYPDHLPVKLGISAIDLATAAAAMGAVLAGLRKRDATGRGLALDLAMADVGVWMTQRVWPDVFCSGIHPVRLGNRSPHASPHDIFPAMDGRFVAIAIESDAQWRALKILIGAEYPEGMDGDATARLRNQATIDELVSTWTAGRTAKEAAVACQRVGIPSAMVRELDELVRDPDVAARNMIVELDGDDGKTLHLLGNPAALLGTPPRLRRRAPALGDHTRRILEDWLGLADGKLDELEAEGVIISGGRPSMPDTDPVAEVANGA